MATRAPGARLPLLAVEGTHATLGQAMGRSSAVHIRAAVEQALATLHEQGIDDATLNEQIAPFVEAAERIFPQYLVELRAMADAAGVPFPVLFRLNCYESRPPGTPPAAAPAAPSVPVKDPGVLPRAGNGAAPAGAPDALVPTGIDGCTSVVSAGRHGIVAGHTEDSYPSAADGLYLLDATVTERNPVNGAPRHRFLALNYAQTLPGCAAAVNEYGLVVLIDALPDPERRVGAPRHFLSRALLDAPSIDAALDLLHQTQRAGGWNFLLVQGTRAVNAETTATRVAVTEIAGGAYAHTNHFLDSALAAQAIEPRENSLKRLARALELARPGMTVAEMKALLSDRHGFPDSICRERTIGAFVVDTAARQIEVCWGEPHAATWTSYAY
jgi:hypothetical protein